MSRIDATGWIEHEKHLNEALMRKGGKVRKRKTKRRDIKKQNA